MPASDLGAITPGSYCQLCGASSSSKERYVTHENPWVHFVGPLCQRCFAILTGQPEWLKTSPDDQGEATRQHE